MATWMCGYCGKPTASQKRGERRAGPDPFEPHGEGLAQRRAGNCEQRAGTPTNESNASQKAGRRANNSTRRHADPDPIQSWHRRSDKPGSASQSDERCAPKRPARCATQRSAQPNGVAQPNGEIHLVPARPTASAQPNGEGSVQCRRALSRKHDNLRTPTSEGLT